MAEEQAVSSKGGPPLIPGLVLMTLIGTLVLKYRPLESARPVHEPLPAVGFDQDQWVRARLWQDPLEAVYQEYKKRKRKSAEEPAPSQQEPKVAEPKPSTPEPTDEPLTASTHQEEGPIQWRIRIGAKRDLSRNEEASLQDKADQQASRRRQSPIEETREVIGRIERAVPSRSVKQILAPLKGTLDNIDENFRELGILHSQADEPDIKRVLLLPVFLSGKPYPDDAENRIRSRYAVLSALARAGYAPTSTEKIRWFEPRLDRPSHQPSTTSPPKQEDNASGLIVPFEEFYCSRVRADCKNHPYSHVFVAWIDETGLLDIGQATRDESFDPVALFASIVSQFQSEVIDYLRLRLYGRLRTDSRFRHAVFEWVYREALQPSKQARAGSNLVAKGPWEWARHRGLKWPIEYEIDANRYLFFGLLIETEIYRNPNLFRSAISKRIAPVTAIGPTDSSTFALFWKYREALCSLLGDVTVYSPWATIPENVLRQLESPQSGELDEKAPTSIAETPLYILRTTIPDNILAKALLDELGLRRVSIQSDRIALISEWDTLYGRTWETTVRNEVICKAPIQATANGECLDSIDPERLRKQTDNIAFISYVKGLDGQLYAPHNGEQAQSNKHKDDKDAQKSAGEVPVGNNQMDYLRRLEARLARLAEDRSRFKAIGIVGSDVYDKLMLLQALRPRFPDAIFFTTDLDARLAHKSQYKYTRNLIVASAFGLQLNEDLQGEIPPFRDSYQTGMFLSTLLAVDDKDMRVALDLRPTPDPSVQTKVRRIQQAFKDLQPRLFEIARSGPFDLTDERGGQSIGIHRTPDIQRRRQRFVWPELELIASVLILAVLLLGPVLQILFEKEADWLTVKKSRLGGWIGIIIAIPIFVTLCAVLGLVIWMFWPYEPITYFEGISVWPTEALRLLTACMAVWLLARSVLVLKRNTSCLSHWFVEEASTEVASIGWMNALSTRRPRVDAPGTTVRSLWECYKRLGKLRWRFLRTALMTALHIALGLCLMNLLGWPAFPCRGDAAFLFDTICLALSVGALLFLNYFVFDAARLARGFFNRISQEFVYWRCPNHSATKSPRQCLEDARNSLEKLRLIAEHSNVVGHCVVYPFWLLLLLVLSRSTVFDNWDWPISLVIIIAVAVFMVLGSGMILRASAQNARLAALKVINTERDALMAIPPTIRPDAPTLAQLDYAVAEINKIRIGAFSPISESPVLKAILIPTGGYSIMELITLLSQGGGFPGF